MLTATRPAGLQTHLMLTAFFLPEHVAATSLISCESHVADYVSSRPVNDLVFAISGSVSIPQLLLSFFDFAYPHVILHMVQ